MLDPTGLFDDPKFNKMAFQNKEEFVNAKPFPHIVFENFLDSDLVTELRDNFPDYDDDIAWHIRDTENIKKRYDKKRTASGIEESKIFENYFNENLKEEDVNLDVDSDTDLGQMVATMVNQALNTLEDTNPAKNRQTGLDMITQIRQKLQDPAVVGQIIEDEVQKMLAELA